MAGRLTKRTIDAFKPRGREAYLWDAGVPGFGLRVRPSGARTFVYLYRPGGGRAAPRRKITIGSYGEITLDAARGKARKLAGAVAHDRDPAAEIKAERRTRARAAESTVAGLVPVFAEQYHRARGNRWADEAERTLTFDAVRRWGPRPVASIEAADVNKLLREVEIGRKAPVQSRKLYIALSRFFRWCVAEGHCNGSPVVGVEKPPPEPSRDRVISDTEIGLMWHAAESLGYPFGPCVQLLILTGNRRDEVAAAERAEFNIDTGEWLLPAARSKNKRPHLKHLSPLAIAILGTLPRVGAQLRQPPSPRPSRPPRQVPLAGDLLFTTTGKTPISGFSKVRDNLQALMVAEAQQLGIDPPADDWTFHDLRRSLVTWLAGAGFPIHVADKLLGHTTGAIQGVAAVYQRAEFLPERKAAMLAWGDHVQSLASGTAHAANVIPLRQPG